MFRVKWPRAPWPVTGGGRAPGKVAMNPTPEGDGSDPQAPCAPVRLPTCPPPHTQSCPTLSALTPWRPYHPASHLGFHHSVQGARTPGHTPTSGAESILGAPTESMEGHTDYSWHPHPIHAGQQNHPTPKIHPSMLPAHVPQRQVLFPWKHEQGTSALP